MSKILIILGPTATGKSDLAVRLAQRFNGEIISADSRQVYKGLDIGTGKITPGEMAGITHYLIDIAEPTEPFGVNKWREAARLTIQKIYSQNKLPIICGGTGYYISSLLNNSPFPAVEPDPTEQKRLELKNAQELIDELATLDPKRASAMASSPSERANKRRLARAIIVARRGAYVDQTAVATSSPIYEALQIGLELGDIELKERILKRLNKRMEEGMIDEAKRLQQNGLSLERMEELGLEYKYLAQFLQGKIDQKQLTDILATKIWQFAKRQRTWWKKDPKIKWFSPNQSEQIIREIELFLGLDK